MRRRVLITSLLSTLAALIVLGVPLGFVLSQRNYREAVLSLERQAAAAQRLVPDEPSTEPIRFPVADGDVQIGLYDAGGALIGGRGPVRSDAVVRKATAGQLGADGRTSDRLVVAIPVEVAGDFYGVIRVDDHLSDLRRRDFIGWTILGGLGILALLAAAAAGSVLARRLIRPAEDLRADARRLGEGDFTVRPRKSGVAELDEIGADLARAAEHLGMASNRERSFSADVSHQLKTPLASLRLAIEAELLDPSADAASATRDLLVDVDRLENTITGLLALARDTHSDRQRIDLRRLLESTERRFTPLLGANRSMSVVIANVVPAPLASTSAIEQTLDVLVDNAIRHGGGHIIVSARSTGPGGAIIGVSDEGLAVIDERVLRERRADTAQGHGIGLALARRLVETEGGQLRLASAGPAPRFEIVLPA